MPYDFRALPPGEWIIFGSLPKETTAENFSEWLRNIGFEVTADCLSVSQHGPNRCSAVVSFPHPEFAVLVNWVINKQTFMGLQAEAQPCARKERPPRR